MSYATDHPTRCALAPSCTASFPGSKWHAMKAQREGWFFSREEDEAYCPDHVPGWVAAWRANKAAGPHHHLTWYGHRQCTRIDCPHPKDDPALDMACTHPGTCEGDCEAAAHNAARRAHLPAPHPYRGYHGARLG